MAISSILLTLAMLEVGLRFFGVHGTYYIQPDDVLGWRYPAGAPYKEAAVEGCPGWNSEGQINSHGLRDYEYEYTNPENTFRILALGDSFTVGVEHLLAHIWPKLLEQMLNQRQDDIQYEVINAGRGAAGTTYEYLYYVTEGYRYTPDLVILLVIGNDVADNSRFLQNKRGWAATYYPFYTLEADQLVLDDSFKKTPGYRLRKIAAPLRQTSALLNNIHRWTVLARHRLSSGLDMSGWLLETDHHDELETVEEKVFDDEAFGSEYAKAVAVTQRLIAELNGAVAASGAALTVFNGTHELIWEVPEQPDDMLTEVVASEGIPYLNLVPALEDYFIRTGEYVHGCPGNGGNGHWSKTGHLQAATLMYDFLLDNGLLP